MYKRLIYQVAIGSRSKLYDFCINSVKHYCGLHGIEHIVQKKPELLICPEGNHRSHEAWHKIDGFPCLPIFEKEKAFDYLYRYEQICVIDADVYIRPDAPNIFDEMTRKYTFGCSVERDMPITDQYKRKLQQYSIKQYGKLNNVDWKWNNETGAEFCNMGVMAINSEQFLPYLRGETAKEFIQRQQFKKFVDGEGDWKRSTDQTMMNWWIKEENMKVKHLDWKWNALYKGIRDDKLKDAYFIHFFLKNKLPKQGEDIQMLKNIVAK